MNEKGEVEKLWVICVAVVTLFLALSAFMLFKTNYVNEADDFNRPSEIIPPKLPEKNDKLPIEPVKQTETPPIPRQEGKNESVPPEIPTISQPAGNDVAPPPIPTLS